MIPSVTSDPSSLLPMAIMHNPNSTIAIPTHCSGYKCLLRNIFANIAVKSVTLQYTIVNIVDPASNIPSYTSLEDIRSMMVRTAISHQSIVPLPSADQFVNIDKLMPMYEGSKINIVDVSAPPFIETT